MVLLPAGLETTAATSIDSRPPDAGGDGTTAGGGDVDGKGGIAQEEGPARRKSVTPKRHAPIPKLLVKYCFSNMMPCVCGLLQGTGTVLYYGTRTAVKYLGFASYSYLVHILLPTICTSRQVMIGLLYNNTLKQPLALWGLITHELCKL